MSDLEAIVCLINSAAILTLFNTVIEPLNSVIAAPSSSFFPFFEYSERKSVHLLLSTAYGCQAPQAFLCLLNSRMNVAFIEKSALRRV